MSADKPEVCWRCGKPCNPEIYVFSKRSLVELLEEKGILTQEEYEKRIMEKVKVK
jgi:hypothetical protein